MDPREWLFDKRVVTRNLDKGVLKQKDYRDYMKDMANLEDEYEVIDVYKRQGEDEEEELVEAEGQEE